MDKNFEKSLPQGRMLILLSIFVLSNLACEPLRKKFTRQKKESEKIEVIPVLTPVDYPPPAFSPSERYAYHYSLWKVWHDDLIDAIDQAENDKREKYLLGQLMSELMEMQRWLVSEKQSGLGEALADLQAVKDLYEKPAPLRQRDSVKRKLERTGKKIRLEYKPSAVSDFLAVE